MNVEIGTEAPIFIFWEYLFQIFGILSLQCIHQEKVIFPKTNSQYIACGYHWIQRIWSGGVLFWKSGHVWLTSYLPLDRRLTSIIQPRIGTVVSHQYKFLRGPANRYHTALQKRETGIAQTTCFEFFSLSGTIRVKDGLMWWIWAIWVCMQKSLFPHIPTLFPPNYSTTSSPSPSTPWVNQ